MVICAASIDKFEEYKLKELGVRDSKKLTPRRREVLFEDIIALCQTYVEEISAEDLNRLMARHSLNEIEAMKIAELLSRANPEKGAVVYVDSPDNVPKKFAGRIEKYFRTKARVVSENKADDKHVIVGAASIVAKVTRDRIIEEIKGVVGFDFNSGYTSDPITRSFLEAHAGDPKLRPYIRTRWNTLITVRQQKLTKYD
jgi:ribonuclease HII